MITHPVIRSCWPDTCIVKEILPVSLEIFLNIFLLRVDILCFGEI
jgi:hypothetical protein